MKEQLSGLIKKMALPLLVLIGVGTYIVVSGTTGTCAVCAAITRSLGIPPAFPGQGAEAQALVTAPDWRLLDLDGNEVASADFEGKVVLIDFWATWCPPCRRMVPGMVALQDAYREQGFAIVAISLDEQGTAVVREFNRQFKVNFTSLLGTEAVVAVFGGVEGIPTSFLIDREGRIVSKHVGYMSQDALEAKIRPLL